MTPVLQWARPPDAPRLAEGAVHVWALALDEAASAPERWWASLSLAERERAERFRFERDRRRFVAAHGQLRALLGRYCGRPAAAITFTYNAYGKPALPDAPLSFNLSHSGEVALIAVAAAGRLGVDIEAAQADLAGLAIAEQFFSSAEVAALRGLPEAERVSAFFNCWTRKEAFVKARGEGLSFPLKAFDVSLAPGAPAALLHTRPDPAEAARWTLTALTPAEGYVAALAADFRPRPLDCWRLDV